MGKEELETAFVGEWHIYEMEMWDDKYFNMEVQAYIQINDNNLGEFQFGLVWGQIDGKIVLYGEKERFEFTFDGNDENDPTSGSGWIEIKDLDKIEGEFRFHMGDDSKFWAKRA